MSEGASTLSNAAGHLCAPRGSGSVLIDPDLSLIDEAITNNRQCAYTSSILGESIDCLAAVAQKHLITAATAYTQNYRDTSWYDPAKTDIIISGHQPELFHPGVWFKNFALSSIAAQHDAIGIQLIIDNDLSRRHSVAVPTGRTSQPIIEYVAYDAQGDAIPHEQRLVTDRETFHSFAARLDTVIKPFIAEPLVNVLWPLATRLAGQQDNLGLAISAARHQLEGQWGLHTLEVPLSHICETPFFRRFLLHIAKDLPRFHEIHNRSLAEYRKEFRVRSHTHPVPELRRQDDWLEAPFWVWRTDAPQRLALWIRCQGNHLEWRCTDSNEARGVWNLSDPTVAIEQLTELSGRGYRFRPRALMTTMYARLFLADVFIHGIGGAKYDVLTDRIIQRFLGGHAPVYFTVSATLQLPLSDDPVQQDDLRQLDGTLRDMWYHPERHLELIPQDAAADIDELVDQKHNLVLSEPAPHERKAHHEKLEQVTQRMRHLISSARREVEQQRITMQERIRNQKLLTSREFSYCLFPAEMLRELLLRYSDCP